MRRRLLVSYLAVTCGVLAVLLVPLALTYRGRLVDERRASLQAEAFSIAALAEDHLEEDRGSNRAALRTAVGRVPLRATDLLVLTDLQDRTLVRSGVAGGGDRTQVRVPIVGGSRRSGTVTLSTSLEPETDRVHRYWAQLAAIAAIALAVVGATGIALARSVSRPLERLRRTAGELGGGNLGVRAGDEAGPPEVRDLARAFDRMADRLADMVRAEAAFVGDASHELRTPLTALRLRLENLAASGAEDDDLAAALEEVERLSRLVEGLLVLARTDAATPTDATPIDLAEVAAARVETWLPLAQELDVALTLVGDAGPVRAQAHADRVVQVLDNLIANALDATAPGGHVVLRCESVGDRAVAHVVDDGPGLSPEDRRRAFDRFWRGPDGERPADGPDGLGGSGLGLAISARLVASDGGSVRLDPAPGGGIDAVVELPAQPRSAAAFASR